MLLELHASDMPAAIRETVKHMVAIDVLPEQLAEHVTNSLLKREMDAPTAIGRASAIPHAYIDGIDEQIVLFVRLAHPINLGAPDGIATRFLFFLLGPPNAAADHLDTLASIARLMSDSVFRYELGKAQSSDELLRALEDFQVRTAPKSIVEAGESTGLFARIV